MCCALFIFLSSLVVSVLGNGERINHVGRILPPTPSFSTPLLFQTPQADSVLESLQIFPPTNSWNEDISMLPLDPNSNNTISKIYNDLKQSSYRHLRFNYDMNYVIIPSNQKMIPITWQNYPSDSDPPMFPIPSNLPIEGWQLGLTYNGAPNETLQQFQTDCQGDCHAMFLNPNGGLWEIYTAQYSNTSGWSGSNGAFFNYSLDFFRGYNSSQTCCNESGVDWSTSKSEDLTSADASGLSVFAGVVRYDEVERGQIEHAIRCQLRCGTGPVYPATHSASQYQGGSCATSSADAQLGMRLRLMSSYVIPSTWSKESQTLARALKQFGCIVTDWASFWSISISPDSRWNQTDSYGPGPFDDIMSISGTGVQIFDMELVTTSATSGPRSPGAPILVAEKDQTIHGLSMTLSANITTTLPSNLTWYTYVDNVTPQKYVSAGNANFSSSMLSIPSAVTNKILTIDVTFPVKGHYYLMASLSDGVHATSYDVVIVDAGGTNGVIRGAGEVGLWMYCCILVAFKFVYML